MLVTIFGDSIGKGIMSDGERRFYGKSAAGIISEKYSLPIDNKSVYGQTLNRLLAKNEIERYYGDKNKTGKKIAVLELGGNDSDYYWKEVAEKPEEEHSSKTDPEDFYRDYKTALKQLRANCDEVYACTLVPVHSARFFNNVVSRVADGERVMRFLKGDVTTVYRHQEIMNDIVLCSACETGTAIIDVRRAFLKSLDFSSYMCEDGIHPNERGQRLMASVAESLFSRALGAAS